MNRLKLETSAGELPIIWEVSIEEYSSNEWKLQNRKMSTRNRLDLEPFGILTDFYMPKNFRGTGTDYPNQCLLLFRNYTVLFQNKQKVLQ